MKAMHACVRVVAQADLGYQVHKGQACLECRACGAGCCVNCVCAEARKAGGGVKGLNWSRLATPQAPKRHSRYQIAIVQSCRGVGEHVWLRGVKVRGKDKPVK